MTRKELKALVPHGYGKIIADKAGVNRMTVSQFLNGNNNNLKVELATLEILAGLSETKRNFVNQIETKQQ